MKRVDDRLVRDTRLSHGVDVGRAERSGAFVSRSRRGSTAASSARITEASSTETSPRASIRVVSVCTRTQNGQSLSRETTIAMYSRSPTVQNDGPRSTSDPRVKKGRPQNSGRCIAVSATLSIRWRNSSSISGGTAGQEPVAGFKNLQAHFRAPGPSPAARVETVKRSPRRGGDGHLEDLLLATPRGLEYGYVVVGYPIRGVAHLATYAARVRHAPAGARRAPDGGGNCAAPSKTARRSAATNSAYRVVTGSVWRPTGAAVAGQVQRTSRTHTPYGHSPMRPCRLGAVAAAST